MQYTSKVYIILVNYNGWKDTLECLESILKNDYTNYQIIVVDNNSSDDSMSYIINWANGFEDMRDLPALIQRINQLKPDAILVALGNPQQERWILRYRSELNAKLLVGVGALLDFMSGSVKRAPGWLRSLRLEWLYRLYGEPKRLFKRYTIEMLRFFILCLKWRLSATFRLQ